MKNHNESTLKKKQRSERGFVLVAALIMLVVLTLLGVSLFNSSGLSEKIAGNTAEKQRAVESAENALQYGEWWLSQGGHGTGGVCSGVVDANTVANMVVCSNTLTNPTTLPWSNRMDYTPAGMTVASGGGLASNGDIKYKTSPSVYIEFMGLSPDGTGQVYRVTGTGSGGTDKTAAVVQSTYQLTSGTQDLGAL